MTENFTTTAAVSSSSSPHEVRNRSRDVAVDFVAGSIGATAAVYIGQPLDTLKVKMQTFPHLYPSFVTCFRETLQKEGVVRGLYAGTIPALAANVAENSVLLAGYGVCQKLVAQMLGVPSVGELSTVANGGAGFFAAFFSSLVLCPTELVKCRLQAMREIHLERGLQPPQIGPFGLTRQILRQDGVAEMFRGLRPTFVREMPGSFCFFFAYELTRELLTPEGKTKDDIGPLKTIFSGGLAGVVLWTIVFPVDVIKSRQQVNGTGERMTAVALNIYRREGFRALYNGLLPTVLKTFPATGSLFFAYEYSRRIMQDYLS